LNGETIAPTLDAVDALQGDPLPCGFLPPSLLSLSVVTMSRLFAFSCVILSTLGPSLRAQDARPEPPANTPVEIVDDFQSATTNQSGHEYPKVNSQRRIQFRIVAPDAKSVGTTFRDSTEFVKGEDGAWIGYSRPLDEGFHYYELIIDGAHVPDPNSTYYFGAMRWGSGIEIPA